MTRSIRIDFEKSSGKLRAARVRGFVSELTLVLGGLGSLPKEQKIDAAIHSVVIADVKRRNAGRCRAIVMRILDKHMLTSKAKITIEGP